MNDQRARGAPPHNKNAVKHGLYVYKAMLDGNRLDRRSSLFKALREKEQELITALGGDPSPQELAIISDCVKTMLYIASLDNYLMGLKSLVRKGRPHPVIATRVQLVASLRESLKVIGLKRVSKTLSLHEILAQPDSEHETTTNSAATKSENPFNDLGEGRVRR